VSGPAPFPTPVSPAFDAEHLRHVSALWDRTTGLAAFHLHLDELRTLLDDRRRLALVHVTCGELGLVESLYGWQVLDRVMSRVVEKISTLRGGVLSRRSCIALNGIGGEEVLVFEPGEAGEEGRCGGEGIGPERAARLAGAIAQALESGFTGPEFSSMTPRLLFRVGYALVEDNPQYRFERVVYRALEQARSQQARREQRRQAEWGAELRRLIREEELVTLFQPIVRLEGLAVAGWEAFTCGPGAGPLSAPGLLFALSEKIGVMEDLDRAGRRAAVASASRLPAGGILFLNARPEALSDPDWQRLPLDPAHVVIDLPEAAVADGEWLKEPVAVLRRHGFSFALDDVGTGYASIRAVENLRPDYLKIDLSLVRDLDRHLLKQEVVASIVAMAARTGAVVVAEGIETEGELGALRQQGVPLGQGFLFARPAPVPDPGPARNGDFR